MKVYCIHLERRPDRKASVQEEFEREGLDVEFFPGTDGRLLAPDGLLISKSEWGCADSHIRVWRDIVAKGHEMALVLEDDVRLIPNFKSKLESILIEASIYIQNWDFINAGTIIPFEMPLEHVAPSIYRGPSYGGHCYLMSLEGAKKVANWDSRLLHFVNDVQLARSPLAMYFVKDPLANQMAAESPLGGLVLSCLDGDLGFTRKIDWDYTLRIFAPYARLLLAIWLLTRVLSRGLRGRLGNF
jgi:hypothetical protein